MNMLMRNYTLCTRALKNNVIEGEGRSNDNTVVGSTDWLVISPILMVLYNCYYVMTYSPYPNDDYCIIIQESSL